MGALEPNYFEPNMLQTPGDSIEDSEVDNRLGKKRDFAYLVKDAKSIAGISPSRQFRVGRNDAT